MAADGSGYHRGVIAEPLSDPGDPRLADYRGVRDPEWLRRRGVFLAEGRSIVATLLGAADFTVRSLALTETALRALERELRALDASVPVYRVDAATLEELSGVRFHQGCVAVGERKRVPAADELLDTARCAVVLEDVTNPDNIGGIFRSAEAFGVDCVLLSPRCASPLYRKALRTSMGASLRIPFAPLPDWPRELAQLGGSGFRLVALSPGATHDLSELRPEPTALLVGNEGDGLSAGALRSVDRHLRIAMAPGADSLNVATATAIALHRLYELERGASR